MDTKENKKNEPVRQEREEVRSETDKLRYEAKERKNNSTRRVNRLWLWLGVLVLIAILLWWLFSIGMFEDASGVINGN